MARMSLELSAPDALRVSACARYMGVSTNYICQAITSGKPAPSGALVKLEAETIRGTMRHTYRIYEDRFHAFLRAIAWKRTLVGTVSAQAPVPSRHAEKKRKAPLSQRRQRPGP